MPQFLPCALRPHVAFRAAIVACALAGCASGPSKEELEAAKNTFACQLSGERLVIRFDSGEARLLMPDAERIVLYQVPMASGVRFTNGTLDLRGKGSDLQLIRNGIPMALANCAPYEIPKQ
jgi:membrane-bound inhibitor of C-type lysozyme